MTFKIEATSTGTRRHDDALAGLLQLDPETHEHTSDWYQSGVVLH